MAVLRVEVLKDSDRYVGDVQREARRITGFYFNKAQKQFGNKAKEIHPEKAIRLAKKNVASIDYIITRNIDDKYVAKISSSDIIALGHDIANGRRFNAKIEN